MGRSFDLLRPIAADAVAIRGYQNIGVVLNASAGNVIAGNTIANNLTGVSLVNVSASNNQVTSNFINSNYVGVFLNNAFGNLISGNVITANQTLGVTLLGALASKNVVRANSITRNGTTGVYLETATDNTIGGTSAADANTIVGNGVFDTTGNGIGVYFARGATKNLIEQNKILSNTGYGVFLFNSADNVADVFRSGPNANQIEGNRIANFREFTGPDPELTGVSTPPRKTAATPKGPRAATRARTKF